MQLARAIARQKEIGVRLCLGASRWRLVRQLLIESLVLSVVGGVAGVLLAWWSLNLFLSVVFVSYGGAEMERIAIDLTPDWRVLGYSFGLALLSGIAFGLVPALRATRPDLMGIVKSEGATASGRSARSRLSGALVVAQVTICFVLLIPAGLLLRSVQLNLSTDPGYEAKNLLSVGYSLELSGYDAERAKVFQQQLMTRLAALPSVKSVSLDREFMGSGIITLLDQGGTGPKCRLNKFPRHSSTRLVRRWCSGVRLPSMRKTRTRRYSSSVSRLREGSGRGRVRSASCCESSNQNATAVLK
jgi:hypothetical protein